jgi:ABC-type phosphate transport system substrate-binding protein
MKILISFSVIIMFIINSYHARAEISIIVNKDNSSIISESEISRIFLGKIKNFPGGSLVVTVSQLRESSTADEFNLRVLKKSTSQLRSYWSKMIFTGQGSPPKEVQGDLEVIQLVSKNPNIIGYIDSSAVTSDVRVIQKY